MRVAVDTGGTFTDVVVQRGATGLSMFKAPTTPNAIDGVVAGLRLAAEGMGYDLSSFLGDVETFIYGTTAGINAVLTGTTATTALLVTAGHPDILLLREGGRTDPFNFRRRYPDPYVPRALTWEIPERVGPGGEVWRPMDEARVGEIVGELAPKGIEAVAVCLLWSIVNPVHERRIGEIIREVRPDLPVTLSHEINPIIREYRRASATSMDASLKPRMARHFTDLRSALSRHGFSGRLMVFTSSGGVLDIDAVASAPIHTINSGPAMAPVAGRYYAMAESGARTAIVADTGGTSYDISVVRDGQIPRSVESWVGEPLLGHMTGFPSVDVRSIGAGGGSIAWIDSGGMLHVGPQSAGSSPGPACYGRGGSAPTVTDAAVVLGYIDPGYFLGGSLPLDPRKAEDALLKGVAGPLGLDAVSAAAAIFELVTEQMIHAIEGVTVNRGIDPSDAVLIAGGGAAGLNGVAIARRLRCRMVLFPDTAAVLSAAGGLMSELTREFRVTSVTKSSQFDFARVNGVLASLEREGRGFIERAGGAGSRLARVDFAVEARYTHQVWELEVPLRGPRFSSDDDVQALCADFHRLHQQVFAISDPDSEIEAITWRARASCGPVSEMAPPMSVRRREGRGLGNGGQSRRQVVFPRIGAVDAAVLSREDLHARGEGAALAGPAIIQSPYTTIVLDPGASAGLTSMGSIAVSL